MPNENEINNDNNKIYSKSQNNLTTSMTSLSRSKKIPFSLQNKPLCLINKINNSNINQTEGNNNINNNYIIHNYRRFLNQKKQVIYFQNLRKK